MEKIYDVTALGEMLIDFAVNGESEQGNQLFEACPGGAPCNVLAMLNKLGRKTAFIVGCRLSIGSTYNKNVFSDLSRKIMQDAWINLQCNLSRPGHARAVKDMYTCFFTYLRCPYGQHSAYSHNYLFPDQFFDIFRFRHRTDRTFFHCDQCCTCIRICQNLF